MSLYLLDSSALLALVHREPGADNVEAVLGDCCIHALHLSETARKLQSIDLSITEVQTIMADLQLPVIEELTAEVGLLAATYATTWKHLGLSLADRICLSLARVRQWDVITADKKWSQVQPFDCRVLIIR